MGIVTPKSPSVPPEMNPQNGQGDLKVRHGDPKIGLGISERPQKWGEWPQNEQ